MSNENVTQESLLDLFDRARKVIEEVKHIQKILYQLAFVATSDNPKAKEAEEIINKLIEKGVVSDAEAKKALNDVTRWRMRILDKEVW